MTEGESSACFSASGRSFLMHATGAPGLPAQPPFGHRVRAGFIAFAAIGSGCIVQPVFCGHALQTRRVFSSAPYRKGRKGLQSPEIKRSNSFCLVLKAVCTRSWHFGPFLCVLCALCDEPILTDCDCLCLPYIIVPLWFICPDRRNGRTVWARPASAPSPLPQEQNALEVSERFGAVWSEATKKCLTTT